MIKKLMQMGRLLCLVSFVMSLDFARICMLYMGRKVAGPQTQIALRGIVLEHEYSDRAEQNLIASFENVESFSLLLLCIQKSVLHEVLGRQVVIILVWFKCCLNKIYRHFMMRLDQEGSVRCILRSVTHKQIFINVHVFQVWLMDIHIQYGLETGSMSLQWK